MTSLLAGPDDLGEGEARLVPVPGRPAPWRSVVVARIGGLLVAYWNVCRHLPVPLDAGAGRLPPGATWTCSTHGAVFRASDGVCTRGPCAGERLHPVEVVTRGGTLWVEPEIPLEGEPTPGTG